MKNNLHPSPVWGRWRIATDEGLAASSEIFNLSIEYAASPSSALTGTFFRREKGGFWLRIFFFFFALLFLSPAQAAYQFPPLTGRVVDQAQVLTLEQETMLSNRLQALQGRSGHQVVIATVPDLQGGEIRDFGYQLGRAWAIGQKGKNDGVVILIAPVERKTAIEIGYGLEGDLTDALSSIIIRNSMVPKFKSGDYFGGLWAGIDDIEKAIGGQGELITNRVQNQSAEEMNLAEIIPFIIFFFIVIFILSRASRGRNAVFIPGSFGGGGSSWSGGGGGFSGSGGSFGGGGASGGW